MALPGAPGSTPPPRPTPAAPLTPSTGDWPRQATDSIIRVVDSVRDRTAGPAITAARGIVYGTLMVLLGIPLLVLALIGAMRGLEAILEHWVTDPIWIVYLFFGFLFVLISLWAWGKAKKPPRPD